MVVLVVVAVACFLAGSVGLSRWLPELAEGPTGTMVFFVVCGLGGAVLALIGIDVDGIVRGLGEHHTTQGLKIFVVTDGLVAILRDAGTVAALALIAYLIAPKERTPESSEAPSTAAG
jgi:hypothetical protein